jgi:hypothetical protein
VSGSLRRFPALDKARRDGTARVWRVFSNTQRAEAVTTRWPSGMKAAEVTGPSWPERTASSLPLGATDRLCALDCSAPANAGAAPPVFHRREPRSVKDLVCDEIAPHRGGERLTAESLAGIVPIAEDPNRYRVQANPLIIRASPTEIEPMSQPGKGGYAWYWGPHQVQITLVAGPRFEPTGMPTQARRTD